jgi:nucleoid DNA-binding protein
MSQMTPTFNMKNLSDAVAEQFGLSNQDGQNITRFVFERVKKELVDGKQVRLHQFGTLEARLRAAGEARNPKTGERITVPARRVVKLTVSPSLRELVSH